MPVESWAPRGSKKWLWLMDHADQYLTAVDSQKTGDWFAGIFRRYFERFDPSIPDDLDPDEWDIFRIEQQPEDERELYETIRADLFDVKKKVTGVSAVVNERLTLTRSKYEIGFITMLRCHVTVRKGHRSRRELQCCHLATSLTLVDSLPQLARLRKPYRLQQTLYAAIGLNLLHISRCTISQNFERKLRRLWKPPVTAKAVHGSESLRVTHASHPWENP
jgi:hypothetical protein